MDKIFKEQQLKATLEYFNNDELAATSWINKYAFDAELTPDDMHKRMAKEYFRIEEKYINNFGSGSKHKHSEYGKTREPLTEEKIYNYFKNFSAIIPGGSVMSGLGTNLPVSLSNCFVIESPSDSYGSIMKSRTHQVQLAKRRGGVGKDLSGLRPEGSFVNNAAKTSTGAVSFMEVESHIIKEVAQSGRRGALMLTMSSNHPDITKFIEIKQDLTKVTGANISVKFTDEFMHAVKRDDVYVLRFPVDTDLPSNLNVDSMIINELVSVDMGDNKGYFRKVKARDVWAKYVKCSWSTAEPGGIYVSKMINFAPDGVYPKHRMVSTNPCGEIGMGPNDACRLSAINLTSIIDNPWTKHAKLNKIKLYEYYYEGMRLIDNLIDLECEHVDRIIALCVDDKDEVKLWETIKSTMLDGRRTGLGFTGYADMIAMMGLKYGSKEAYEFTKIVGDIKFRAEMDSTIDMSIERGSFNSYDNNLEYDGIKGMNEWYINLVENYPQIAQRMMENGRRNISISTVAPTGTLSMLTQTSSGIEPVFMPIYERKRKINNPLERVDFVDINGEKFTKFLVVHHGLKMWAYQQYGSDVDSWDVDKWFKEFEKSPYFGATAPEINWRDRVELQSLVQKYITHSISSTVNLPKDVTESEISDIFMVAWESGSKGQTVYRDGSRDGILTSLNDNTVKSETLNTPTKRPKTLPCTILRFTNKNEKWVAVIGLRDDKPYEIFTGLLDKMDIPNDIENGNIVKTKMTHKVINEETSEITDVKFNRYDLTYVDNDGNEHTIIGLSNIFNKEYWNYAKLVSGLLRHNMPLIYVVNLINSMKFDTDTINSWKTGVIRALRKFMKNEKTGELCPKCEIGELRHQDSCIICPNCGYDKCGS